jgi:gamma-glutamylcyclotransferase (GGCT)/AIG2-like uncharacterized protein YtfP
LSEDGEEVHARSHRVDFDPPIWPRALFVYGSLMRGEAAHRRIEKYGIDRIEEACVAGTLLDLGEYPGAIAGGETIHGEIVELADTQRTLTDLDAYEDFRGYGRPDSLFRRAIGCAVRTDGSHTFAWIYLYARDGTHARAIASGDWRTR